MKPSQLTYNDRANYCKVFLAKRLLQLVDDKKTNLIVSADVTSANELLDLAALLGPEICMLKTHIDIIKDYTPALTASLRQLANKHRFLLFEDRKFADIGYTVRAQYEGGIYHIADWADVINAHVLPGPGIISALAEAGQARNRALILLAEMSSAGHLMDQRYMQKTLEMAEQFSHFVIGFITQHALSSDPHWINFTPGIKLQPGIDALGQQYITPEKAFLENGTDIVIVGRGIITAKDPLQTTQTYRQQAWQAYLERCAHE